MANIKESIKEALRSGDLDRARILFKEYPDMLGEAGWWLYEAAGLNSVPVVRLLLELGMSVNSPRYSADPSVPLCAAAKGRAFDAARFLLQKGADVNAFRGDSFCPLAAASSGGSVEMVRLLLQHGAEVNVGGGKFPTPLTEAAGEGHLEVVRLLLQHGADPNVVFGTMEYGDPPRNALLQAVVFGHSEVAKLLRAHGAVLPAGSENVFGDSIVEHLQKHLGTPSPLSLHETVPSDPAITVYAVPLDWCVALVTSGMSERAMTVPNGGKAYCYAELVIYLPTDWPLTLTALRDSKNSWPIDWLRRIARYPHENHTWLGGPATVISNDEPPKPFAANTKLSCLLAVTEDSEFGWLELADGRKVSFYTLFPLYTEERDMEKLKGTAHILKLFEQYEIPKAVDVKRPNVAVLSQSGSEQ